MLVTVLNLARDFRSDRNNHRWDHRSAVAIENKLLADEFEVN